MELTIDYTKEELETMLRFYRRGPLANKQARQFVRVIILRLRALKVDNGS